MSSKHTIWVRRVILEIYSSMVARNTDSYSPQPHNERFNSILPFLLDQATSSSAGFYVTLRDHHQRWDGCSLPTWWLGASRQLIALQKPYAVELFPWDSWNRKMIVELLPWVTAESSGTWHRCWNRYYICDAANCTSRMKISNNKPLMEASARVI